MTYRGYWRILQFYRNPLFNKWQENYKNILNTLYWLLRPSGWRLSVAPTLSCIWMSFRTVVGFCASASSSPCLLSFGSQLHGQRVVGSHGISASRSHYLVIQAMASPSHLLRSIYDKLFPTPFSEFHPWSRLYLEFVVFWMLLLEDWMPFLHSTKFVGNPPKDIHRPNHGGHSVWEVLKVPESCRSGPIGRLCSCTISAMTKRTSQKRVHAD
jgi:hypothetical protein